MKLFRTAVLIVISAAVVAASSGDDAAEEAASAALAKAEERAAKGHYARALSAYRKLVKRWPDTDAGERASRRLEPNAVIGWSDVVRNGPSENRLDIVILGDGYPLGDQSEYDDAAGDVPTVFDRTPVFREYGGYLNLIRANVVSEDEGVDGFGREYSTALGARIREGDPSGVVEVDVDLVHARLDELPAHDGIAIAIVKRGTGGTGGNGVATIGGRGFDTLLHEFGHGLGRLADEYASDTGTRPSETVAPNVAYTEDPDAVPWAHFLRAKVRGVGIYEGADGRVRGAFKPTSAGCSMGDAKDYCPVCVEALVLAIHEHVSPIDACTPDAHPPVRTAESLRGPGPHRFEVRTLRPATHAVEVRFWVLPEDHPAAGRGDDIGSRDRRARGPLVAIEEEPLLERLRDKKGVHRFEVDPTKLEPGRYRVVCRARDPAQPRGERWPWVLSDERGLLEAERGWWVVVE